MLMDILRIEPYAQQKALVMLINYRTRVEYAVFRLSRKVLQLLLRQPTY